MKTETRIVVITTGGSLINEHIQIFDSGINNRDEIRFVAGASSNGWVTEGASVFINNVEHIISSFTIVCSDTESGELTVQLYVIQQ